MHLTTLLGLKMAIFLSASSHLPLSIDISVCEFPLFIRTPVAWVRALPKDLILKLLLLQKSCLQMRSHREVLGVKMPT
jgi:hypothetical protein